MDPKKLSLPTDQQGVVFNLNTMLTQAPVIIKDIQKLHPKASVQWMQMLKETEHVLATLQRIGMLTIKMGSIDYMEENGIIK